MLHTHLYTNNSHLFPLLDTLMSLRSNLRKRFIYLCSLRLSVSVQIEHFSIQCGSRCACGQGADIWNRLNNLLHVRFSRMRIRVGIRTADCVHMDSLPYRTTIAVAHSSIKKKKKKKNFA